MGLEFGDVVVAEGGVRHLVLGVVTHEFETFNLLVTHDDADSDLMARLGDVVCMSIATDREDWPFGFIDAHKADKITKED